MFLVTSNHKKLEEFQRILPELESQSGDDLREVDGTPEEVIIYKSLEAGVGSVVEDTILIIDGKEVVDIKWKIDELKSVKTFDTIDVSWQVLLGYNTGKHIEIYRGTINGILLPGSIDKGYGFDPYILPDGADVSLAVLETEGNKDKFSARYNALINLKNKKIDTCYNISTLPPWVGKYQNEKID